MKRKLVLFIASLLILGSINAQEDHWSMNSYDYMNARPFYGKVMIDGVMQSTTDIEIAAFVGEQVRAVSRLVEIAPSVLPGQYFIWFNIKYNNAGESVTFKIYDHATTTEYDNYSITVNGEPLSVVTGMDNPGSASVPVMLDFITPTSTQTFTKDIIGYGEGAGRYYLIATPIDDMDPTDVANMIPETEDDYDLYWFDQTAEREWRNYKQGTFNLASGMGYLYANKNNVTLTFSGTPVAGTTFDVSLVKDDDAEFPGWNLVGNPFTGTAYIADNRPFYVMNSTGTGIVASELNKIKIMEGIFVIATEDGEEMTFTAGNSPSNGKKIVLNMVQNRDGVIDRAIVRFDNESVLPKFTLNDNVTKLYIPQDGQDYAVVYSEPMGVLPINFEAANNGNYTIIVDTEGVEMQYLHLIDNMTGTDVDLLTTPSYSFEALTTDYASRFKLVYSSGDTEGVNETFAFINNGNIIINGEGMVQMVDMMGRVVVFGDAINRVSTSGMTPGVYVLRLVNGNDVKTQKLIIK